MKKWIICLLAGLGTWSGTVTGQENKQLTLEDIFQRHTFRESYVWGIRPMKDGQHYSKIEYDYAAGLGNIYAYDFETGKLTDTIFKGSWLVPEDSTKAIAFDEYALSHDETKLLLATGTERIYRHSTREFNYIWDRKSRSLTLLSDQGKQRYAAFSSDGTKVGFVRDNNLYYKDLVAGEEVQITTDGKHNAIINGASDWVYEEEFGITRAYFWSPDDRKIAFIRFDESRVKEFSMDMFTGLYPEQYRFKYPKAGEENAIVTVHIYDLATKGMTTVDIGPETDQYIPRLRWTQDANKLCVYRMNRHQNKLELLLADANTGKTEVLLTEKNKYYVNISDDLTFLKDGAHFLWSSEADGYRHIYLYDMQGKKVRQITSGKWDVTNFYGIDEAEAALYFQSAEESPLERYVYTVRLDGTGKRKLSSGEGMHRSNFNPGFTYYINYHSSANAPTETAIYNAAGKLVRILEDNKGLKQKLGEYALNERTFFSFKTSEKVTLNGWMIKPPDFDPKKKYPVFMFVYGGPGSQTVQHSWGGTNQLWYHYLAQQGYIVASVDNRGTGARGEAFRKMTYRELGKYETADQIEAARYLAGLDYTDGERIGIWGWSYGGYMSSLCITKGADVFKLAIAVAPVTNWRFYDTIYTERYMRTPQENPDGYDDNSPINYVDKLKGHYLLIHGTADDNVHYQNTVEMVEALQQANKQFRLMIYPDKNHGIYGGNTRMHLYSMMTDFILEHL